MQREPKLKAEAFPGIMKKEYETKYSIETSRFMQPGKHEKSEQPTMVPTPGPTLSVQINTAAPAPAPKKSRALAVKKEDPVDVVEQPRMTGKASKPRKLL